MLSILLFALIPDSLNVNMENSYFINNPIGEMIKISLVKLGNIGDVEAFIFEKKYLSSIWSYKNHI